MSDFIRQTSNVHKPMSVLKNFMNKEVAAYRAVQHAATGAAGSGGPPLPLPLVLLAPPAPPPVTAAEEALALPEVSDTASELPEVTAPGFIMTTPSVMSSLMSVSVEPSPHSGRGSTLASVSSGASAAPPPAKRSRPLLE